MQVVWACRLSARWHHGLLPLSARSVDCRPKEEGCPKAPKGFAHPNPSIAEQPARRSSRPYPHLDTAVANASAFTPATRANAESGVHLRAIRLLPAGTTLYRIGSSTRHGEPVPDDRQFSSPWWMRRHELERILAKGLQDTAWAGRVLLAIAEAWGTRCDLQVTATTAVDLYAWIGEGKAIDAEGHAVKDDHPAAFWFPEKDLLQLFVPGLALCADGQPPLWQTAFSARSIEPWLPIGTQRNLATGRAHVARAASRQALPPGRR